MENVSNVSSEEELLQLRNEGKVSKDEYIDLLAAMRKSSPSDAKCFVEEPIKSVSKRRHGIIAFVVMVSGVVLPSVFVGLWKLFVAAPGSDIFNKIGPWFYLAVVFLEIVAFTLSIIALPDIIGKVTFVFSSLIVIVITLVFGVIYIV